MKTSLLIALMVCGLSFNALADDHEGEMDSEHETEMMDAPAAPTAKAKAHQHKDMAMSAKSAKAACKKEGKKGKALADCVKSKTSTH